MTNSKPEYVLIAMGRVLAEGDDPAALFSLYDLSQFGRAAVKSWRLHQWVPGIPGSIFSDEHCVHCKATRQRNGNIDAKPCKFPERSGDDSVEVFPYHAEHTDDMCCMEHNHHAKGMHVNCMFR